MINTVEATKKAGDENFYDVKDLRKSCKNHLVNLKILHDYDIDPGITEKELIEDRCNIQLHDSSSICSYHRYFYGI